MASVAMVDLGVGPYLHETPSKRFPIYTRGNAGEVWPEVGYPLTIDSWRSQTQTLTDMTLALGMVTESDIAEGITVGGGCFGGYMYLNLSLVRAVALRSPGVTIEEVDATYLGSEGLAPPHVPTAHDRNWRGTVAALTFIRSLLKKPDTAYLATDRAIVTKWQRRQPELVQASNHAAIRAIRDLHRDIVTMFGNHIDVTSRAGGAVAMLAGLVEKPLGDRDAAMGLLTGLGDIDSAAPSEAMWELSRAANANAAVSAAFDAGIEGLHDRLMAEPTAAAFVAEFSDFLVRFGSRGPNEWETACDTWGTRPELALTLIDRMRAAGETQSPAARTAALKSDRGSHVAAARSQMRFGQKRLFDKAIRSASEYSVARERSKTTVVDLIQVLRVVARSLAERVSAEVPGGHWEDMWFCFDAELDGWVDDPGSMVDVIAERRAVRNELSRRIPPFVFDGELPPADTWPLRESALDETNVIAPGGTISGLAAVPGVAEGRACVVTDPFAPGDLGPGDVLIAPLTDPAWTPLFVPVEAVVVDVGGQMSHAVIVAREFGMPCVVAATDATTRIPHGARVRVDGTAGTVTVLAET